MKISAFSLRIAICFLVSLIPVNELENIIHSARLRYRGKWGDVPNIVIFDIGSSIGSQIIQKKLQELGPTLILFPSSQKSNDLMPDSDGVVRRAVLLPNGNPSLTHSAYVQLKMDSRLLENPEDRHLINYVGPAGTIRRCRLSDTLVKSPDNPCAQLEGKILLLNEEDINAVIYRTPLGEMTREEIIANDMNTIINRHAIYEVNFVEKSLIVLAMILLGAFFIISYSVVTSAIALIGTGFLVIFVSFQAIFQIFHVYIPSANASIALLVTHLVFTGYRLAFQENLQWKSVQQSQYLRELDQMKTNFVSLVSHDLKTPLAKIQAIVERLRRELPLPEGERSDWRELLESIEHSNHELKRYITSILNLSRIESQEVILNKKSNDINQLIQQTMKRLLPLAQQKSISIEQSLEPLFSIEFDEDLMRQVLTNLIDNAIKYSPNNSRVIVRSREEDSFVRVEIEDFGPGIPPGQLPMMFRKFSRILGPLQEQAKGTGLGLYLSKYFIELHGGTIQVQSIEGKGTVFSFTLPMTESH